MAVVGGWFRDRAVLLLGAATAIGLGMVVWGWILQGVQYVPSLLLQIGSSLLLIIPLVMLNRTLERRMLQAESRLDAVGNQVAENAGRLKELSGETLSRIDSQRRWVADKVREIARTPTYDKVCDLVLFAWSSNALADCFRVPLADTLHLWCVKRRDHEAAGGPLQVYVGGRAPDDRVPVRWGPGLSLDALYREATAAVESRGTGKSRLVSVSDFKRSLITTLRVAVEAKLGTSEELGNVIEVVNDGWVLSSDGMRSRSNYYRVSRESIADGGQDWSRYMQGKSWVDPEQFAQAYELARGLYANDS